jgi:tetratricopeptide (TPR) repeat protein
VGRDTERRLLWDAFERARREQSLQVVTLIGVPGVGKSRLVWELFRQLDEEPELTYWRQGRALAYGGGPFGAVAEAVRSHLGVLEGEGPAEIAPKLERALDELPLEPDDRAWLLRRLQPLLGIEAGEPPQRGEAFAAWQRLLEGMASVRPFVLVLEDLHWADDGTLDFVDHLSDWASEVPLLIVATARPELLERRPEWGGGKLNSHTLALRPLDERATAELLARLLDRAVIDADLQARLLQQAGGNPLYAEEFARMVSESGADAAIPDSVQGIIAARIDVLDAREKSLLQDAAVLGKVFWRGGLVALGADEEDLDTALQRLARKEFIRRERGSIVGGDAEFAFRHALVRDVAYSQLPRAARATKHRLAAEWIQATAVARPDLVAHHFSEALEIARATGAAVAELERSTRVALWEAADRARSLAAYDDALPLYRRALELYVDPDAERGHLLVELARTANDGGTQEDGRAYGEAARDVFEELGDQAGLSGAETALSRAAWAAGEGPAAREHIRRAVDAALASGDELPLAHALSARARNRAISGDPREAIDDAERALELAERLGLDDVWVATSIALGNARSTLDIEGWQEDYDVAAARALEINAPDLAIRALNNRGNQEVRRNGPKAAHPWYEEMVRIAYHYRLPFSLRWTQATQTWLGYTAGRWDEALAFGESFFATTSDMHYLDAQVLQVRTLIAFARGHDAETAIAADGALARAREVGDMQEMGPILAWRALWLAELGDQSGARVVLAEAASLPAGIDHALDFGLAAVWASMLLGEPLAIDQGDMRFWARAGHAILAGRLEDATAMLDEGGAVTEAAYARLQLVRRSEDPEPWLTQAEAFYRRVGATRYLAQLDELRATRRTA